LISSFAACTAKGFVIKMNRFGGTVLSAMVADL